MGQKVCTVLPEDATEANQCSHSIFCCLNRLTEPLPTYACIIITGSKAVALACRASQSIRKQEKHIFLLLLEATGFIPEMLRHPIRKPGCLGSLKIPAILWTVSVPCLINCLNGYSLVFAAQKFAYVAYATCNT